MENNNNNLKTVGNMKFSINEKFNLTIEDDKKTLILESDKHDLIALKELIEKSLNEIERRNFCNMVYNPRSQRWEKQGVNF